MHAGKIQPFARTNSHAKKLPLGLSDFVSLRSDCEKLLNQAVEQMESRRFGLSFSDKEVIRVAVVFDGQRREINRWKAL